MLVIVSQDSFLKKKPLNIPDYQKVLVTDVRTPFPDCNLPWRFNFRHVVHVEAKLIKNIVIDNLLVLTHAFAVMPKLSVPSYISLTHVHVRFTTASAFLTGCTRVQL